MGLLAELMSVERLSEVLPPPGAWRPVPTIEDRAAWNGVDPAFRRKVVTAATAARWAPWPPLTASMYGRFHRDGNRQEFESAYFRRRGRLLDAVLAAAMTDETRFLDEVVDGIWLLCEETTWCLPAHSSTSFPDPGQPELDLFTADTAGLLAYASTILGPRLDPAVRERLCDEVRERVLVPYHGPDRWWYAGDAESPINNWNPWIHSNILAASLLLGEDRAHVAATVRRVLVGLDNFLSSCPDDGGCDEGATYWWYAGGCLFECLEILHSATGGAYDPFDTPVLRRIARYPVVAHIDADWHVNFADGAARLKPGVAAPALLHRFGRAVGDPVVSAHAAALANCSPYQTNAGIARAVVPLFDREWRTGGDFPYVDQEWLPTTEILVARERPHNASGLYLTAKGGHNLESHNHNDVGSFIIALDGRPVLIDVGVGTYTRQTFSQSERYKIWTMRSLYHNLPVVNGIEQAVGRDHRATSVACQLSDAIVSLTMDLRDAYPPQAGIAEWRRHFVLDRSAAAISIEDSWILDREPESLVLHLMTADPVSLTTPGVLALSGATVSYDDSAFAASIEAIPLTDPQLTRVWGNTIRRIALTARAGNRSGVHRITIQAN